MNWSNGIDVLQPLPYIPAQLSRTSTTTEAEPYVQAANANTEIEAVKADSRVGVVHVSTAHGGERRKLHRACSPGTILLLSAYTLYVCSLIHATQIHAREAADQPI